MIGHTTWPTPTAANLQLDNDRQRLIDVVTELGLPSPAATFETNVTTMSDTTALVVGATGSIGRHVVAESPDHPTRALVGDTAKARDVLPTEADLVVGDVPGLSLVRAKWPAVHRRGRFVDDSADQLLLHFHQGDTRHAGNSSDGGRLVRLGAFALGECPQLRQRQARPSADEHCLIGSVATAP